MTRFAPFLGQKLKGEVTMVVPDQLILKFLSENAHPNKRVDMSKIFVT